MLGCGRCFGLPHAFVQNHSLVHKLRQRHTNCASIPRPLIGSGSRVMNDREATKPPRLPTFTFPRFISQILGSLDPKSITLYVC
jgi:hypothetical protein